MYHLSCWVTESCPFFAEGEHRAQRFTDHSTGPEAQKPFELYEITVLAMPQELQADKRPRDVTVL